MLVPFAELCAKSSFSFLEGASQPEELVRAAKELGLEALGIADRDGIYGLVRAFREARTIGQRLVSGSEMALRGASGAPPRVILLVRDHAGYQSLCRALTRAHRGIEAFDPDAPTSRSSEAPGLGSLELAEHAAGLELLLPIDDDWLAESGGQAGAGFEASHWQGSGFAALLEAFRGRVHVVAHRRLDGLDAARDALARALAEAAGARVIASGRPLHHHPSRRMLADVLHCIRHKTTLDEAGARLLPNAEARLRSAEQMNALFRDELGWVERSAELASGLGFSFSELAYRFPSDELCRPGESPDEALRRLVAEGKERRYPEGVPSKVEAQLEKELVLIARLGVAAYFLSVHEIVEMARRRRILCQGRGSAANSAVCYVLGVTAVDPARSSLLFERFLSAERAEPPDIDVDFEHERREEVIQDIYARWGRARAAMVCEVISYRAKSTLREVGKVLGLSLDQAERLSSVVLHSDLGDVSPATLAGVGLDPSDARLGRVLSLAAELEGFPRHLSIHVGGFVLSSEPLDAVAPIQPARMPGRSVIPWDKDDLDTLGFFKVDVLGLGMLTCIRKCLAELWALGRAPGQREGEAFDPIEALARVPPECPTTYEAIGRADTVGVFQIESRAQMSMLPRLLPRCFYDLVIEVAIVRPGPIQGGMVHPYLRRRQGKEAARAPHPILEPILARTLGVPLFQEQVMQIAMVGAGYGAGEADQLRRDMAAWKKHGRLERHRERLLEGFARSGISARFGEALYKQIQGFGEYGFPESHAASFALLVYASSWLKTHHPGVFACALLDAQPMGFYSPSSIVQDAQRHGVVVREPRVDLSHWDCTLEPEPSSFEGLALRLGLRQIKGLGEASGRRIEVARAERAFESVGELARRAELSRAELEALAEAGALEPLAEGRRQALWQAHAPRLGGLFEACDLERGSAPPELPPLRRVEQLLLDYGRLGLSVDDHPMRHLRKALARRRVFRAAELEGLEHGARVRVAGLVTGRQRPYTASGVMFISLEDETGIANLVVRVPIFERYRHTVLHARIALVSGKLEREGRVIHVLVETYERLTLPREVELPGRSRDFH